MTTTTTTGPWLVASGGTWSNTASCTVTWWQTIRVRRRLRTMLHYWRAAIRYRDERYIDAIGCAARGRHRIKLHGLALCLDCGVEPRELAADRPL